MGYTVTNMAMTKDYVLANGVALFLAYAVLQSQIRLTSFARSLSCAAIRHNPRNSRGPSRGCWKSVAPSTGSASQVQIQPTPAAFSIFPPFYFGIHSVVLGWLTLIVVLLMHIFSFVRKCDGERSAWSYSYFIYHASIFTWMMVALCLGYYESSQQPQATDTN